MSKLKYKWQVILIAIIISLLLTIGIGINKAQQRIVTQKIIEKQLFSNIKGIQVKCKKQEKLLYHQACQTLIINIPSLASVYDDKGNQSKKANLVINREELDKGMDNWIKAIYNEQEAKKIANHVIINYRDITIIDETYSFLTFPF